MTFAVRGPGAAYDLLFDDDITPGRSLPQAFQAIYGSDWRLPVAQTRPYTFCNFVVSRDGRIAFDDGSSGGADISRNVPHDKWLMALLRARADAILVGSATLRSALRHRWTPQAVFRADADAFAALRTAEGRELTPLLVVATRSGKLPSEALVLRDPQQHVLVATTTRGAEQAQHILGQHDKISYHITDGSEVDFAHLARDLHDAYKVSSLLCEGGAQVYGAFVQAQLVDDEFLTVSPIMVGNPPPPASPRPSLIEGVAFHATNPPQIDLLSLRRHESYLFQRSRYRQAEKQAPASEDQRGHDG